MEKSQFWYTDGFTGATGDGAAPYTQEEFRAYNAALLGEGVVAGAENELAVSGSATPLSVATGRAQVAGFHYWNDAAKNLTVTTPSVGTTGGRVVLRADWTAATVRLFVLLNTDGNAGIPALTQTLGATYEISLASFTVTTGGVITLTDTRQFALFRGAGMIKLREYIGSGAAGSFSWTSIQQNLRHLLIVGSVLSDAAAVNDAITLTFNGDTGNNYAYNRMAFDVASGVSVTVGGVGLVGNIAIGEVTGGSGAAGFVDPLKIQIPNYAQSLPKTALAELADIGDGTFGGNGISSNITHGWWDDTTGINRIDLELASGNFETGTKITLFGIA